MQPKPPPQGKWRRRVGQPTYGEAIHPKDGTPKGQREKSRRKSTHRGRGPTRLERKRKALVKCPVGTSYHFKAWYQASGRDRWGT